MIELETWISERDHQELYDVLVALEEALRKGEWTLDARRKVGELRAFVEATYREKQR